MFDSLTQIHGMFLRYVFLHRRSLMIRAFDIFFWPVMDLLIWGFVTLYVQRIAETQVAQLMLFLIGAMILWDIHYRGQQAVTISLMEEIWNRNLTNILISPLRLWEWLAATCCYGALKVGLVTLILALVAKWLYAFDLIRVGWAFLPLAANLLIFGWGIGLVTSGLLLRFGYAAEALIWGVPFLVQPFADAREMPAHLGECLEAVGRGARSAAYPVWYASDKPRRPTASRRSPQRRRPWGRRHLRPPPASLLLGVAQLATPASSLLGLGSDLAPPRCPGIFLASVVACSARLMCCRRGPRGSPDGFRAPTSSKA